MVHENIIAAEALDSVERTIKKVVKPLFDVGMTKEEVKTVIKMRLDKAYDAFVLNPTASRWSALEEGMTCWQYLLTNPQAGEPRVG